MGGTDFAPAAACLREEASSPAQPFEEGRAALPAVGTVAVLQAGAEGIGPAKSSRHDLIPRPDATCRYQ